MAFVLSKNTQRFKVLQGGDRTSQTQYGNTLRFSSFDNVTTFIHEVTHDFDEKLAWPKMQDFLQKLRSQLPKRGMINQYLQECDEKKRKALQKFLVMDRSQISSTVKAKSQRKLRDLQNLSLLQKSLSTQDQDLEFSPLKQIEELLDQISLRAKNIMDGIKECSLSRQNVDLNEDLTELEEKFSEVIELGFPLQNMWFKFQALQYQSRNSLYCNENHKELLIQIFNIRRAPGRGIFEEVQNLLVKLGRVFNFTTVEYPGIKTIDEILARLQEHLIDNKLYRVIGKLIRCEPEIIEMFLLIIEGHITSMEENRVVEVQEQLFPRDQQPKLFESWKQLQDILRMISSNWKSGLVKVHVFQKNFH